MKIKNITKKDLPMLAKLAKDESIKEMEDICFNHSKMGVSDDGEVLCFMILRKNSLIDFFNGEIPMNEDIDKNDKDYYEDDEWWERDVITMYNGMHYEVVAAYLKDKNDYDTYINVLNTIENDSSIEVLWSTKELPLRNDFYLFNKKVWLNPPILD